MPTRKIPEGTDNIVFNARKPVRTVLGRIAYARDDTISGVIRDALAPAIARACLAGDITREVAIEALTALRKDWKKFLCLVFLSFLSAAGSLPRRPRRASWRSVPSRVVRMRSTRKIGEWDIWGDGMRSA